MLQKNDVIELEIQSVTNEGSGVGRYEGMAVFVPMTAAGELVRVKIVKVLKSYCYGIVEQLLRASPARREPDCPVFRRCGGCSLRHLDYREELRCKETWVQDVLQRIGGISLPVSPILPSPQEQGYRNKAQYPFGVSPQGKVFCGFYANRTHAVIPAEDCRLQPPFFQKICRAVCAYIDQTGGKIYQESTGKGLFRHLYLRWAEATGEVMVCLVVNGDRIPRASLLVERVLAACPQTASIQLNVNTRNTNVILGPQNILLWGKEAITDVLAGVRVRISPLSFYQVNHQGAEMLYKTAADMAQLKPEDRLLDLYCGAGTIGLSMARRVGELTGVEIVESAVEDARQNAGENDICNARFYCEDAGKAASRLVKEGLCPDVVILDPPRKGCDEPTLNAVCTMAPQRLVMISCNPATMARDLKSLIQRGYEVEKIQPVDMFPRTNHVECCALLKRSPLPQANQETISS